MPTVFPLARYDGDIERRATRMRMAIWSGGIFADSQKSREVIGRSWRSRPKKAEATRVNSGH